MNEWLELFAPKKVLKIAGALPQLWLRSFLKYWFITIPVFVIHLTFVWRWIPQLDTFKGNFWWSIFWIVLVSNLPSIVVYYLKSCKIANKTGLFTIGIVELFTVSGKDYFDTNFDTNRINERQKDVINDLIRNKSPFKDGLVSISLITRPKIYYLTHSLTGLKRDIRRQMAKHNINWVLVVHKDEESNSIGVDIITSSLLVDTQVIEDFRKAFSIQISQVFEIEQYVIEVSKLFLAKIGQSVINFLIERNLMAEAHFVNDDTEAVFKNAIQNIEQITGTEVFLTRTKMKNNFVCNCSRNQGLIMS